MDRTFSNKQKRGIEKVSGKRWDFWSPEAVERYFLYTDKGIKPDQETPEFTELLERHHSQTIIVEMWKEGFKSGLLFLDDFLFEDYPIAYLQYVVEIYEKVMSWMPSKYLCLLRERGIKSRYGSEILKEADTQRGDS